MSEPTPDQATGQPVDERLAAMQDGGEDPQLLATYFQYGRYLLLSSSRPGTLPANLQGLWAQGLTPPWSADYHININIINPGWIDTPGERQFANEDELRRGGNRIPWGRLGTPRDIGRCADFLASDSADYITGARIRVDGGYMSGLALRAN